MELQSFQIRKQTRRQDCREGKKQMETFGELLTRRRKEKGITLREFARRTGVSAEYLCNIEKSRRTAPPYEILQRFAAALLLSKEEAEEFYDSAASSKNTVNAVPEDLTVFLRDNRRIVLTALRTAKDVEATDEEWEEFMKMLKANREKKEGPENEE